MSEPDFTVANYQFAAWMLRVEHEAMLVPAPSPPVPEPFPTVAAFYEFEVEDASGGLDSDQYPAGPVPPDRPTEIDAVSGIDQTTDGVPIVRPPSLGDALAPVAAGNPRYFLAASLAACALLAVAGWRLADVPGACWLAFPHQDPMVGRLAADVVARRIVVAESGGDAIARNTRSSATGAGQFLDGTWLDMIRAYRPDLGARTDAEILDLRYDPDISREMVARFAEENAAVLGRRCLPVTPGTLYLSHFAGGAGAVAVLSAPETADAAATMAGADSTGRTTREMIVTANPFRANFTVADLKRWADRKMRGGGWPL
jgi:hypothetical protein